MSCCYKVTRTFVLFFLLLGLVAVVLSGLIDFWWTHYEEGGIILTADKGLWRTCGFVIKGMKTSSCFRREYLLEFKENGFDLDIIVVSLIGSAFFVLVSLILIAISMCQKYPSKLLILSHLLSLLLGASGGIFALVWAMLKVSDKHQGWAFYCLYGGDGCLVVAFCLSLVLLCAKAPGYYLIAKRSDENDNILMKEKDEKYYG